MNRRTNHITPIASGISVLVLVLMSLLPSLIHITQYTGWMQDSDEQAMSCSMDGMCSCSSMESCSCSMDMGAMSCSHDADDGPSFCGCSTGQSDWFTVSINGIKAVVAVAPQAQPPIRERSWHPADWTIPAPPFIKSHKPPA
jgi:uncharacterized membrane protein